MKEQSKVKIKDLLEKFCEGFTSQAKASKALKDVSPGTISQILNDKWDLIADRMWINIGKQVGFEMGDWKVVETYNYKVIRGFLMDAKAQSRVHAITGGAGWGKDAAVKDFATEVNDVYLINCAEYFNKKYFMMELLKAMGKSVDGTVPMMVERAVTNINKTFRPLVILNEVDKLKDEAFYFIITFYNLCEDKCGIVALATDQLEKRISRGLFLNKKGYQEIFSRFGRRFIELKKPSKADVTAICTANGVTNPEHISEIYNSSEGDLRRAKKLIQNKATTEPAEGEQAA
ncbi:AAA family ATPase [Mucilaginibacter sp. 5C4]|uniref:AAA family ATPase n=1 Tax=Mucilaginibacter sp. 5C4 TaxID=3048589 RepID=UPI002AC8BDC6|nr:AAA family ATPase [Mucilaginibacter sp. 5C4]MEB0299584.1 AAA family ATPase [Mucilaginibacter sp. 5C4]WPX22951.1 AAA family ATPase [Mucilaginibacter sp. 5C4]